MLGPALEGFSSTPECPAIAEAKALFEALAEIEVVKTTMAARRQRLALQVSFGNALIAARGYGETPETTAAFARALVRLRATSRTRRERLSAIYGLCGSEAYGLRGELGQSMREFAAMLSCARSTRNGVLPKPASRIASKGVTHWHSQGISSKRAATWNKRLRYSILNEMAT